MHEKTDFEKKSSAADDRVSPLNIIPVIYAVILALIPLLIKKFLIPPSFFLLYTHFLHYTALTLVVVYVFSFLTSKSASVKKITAVKSAALSVLGCFTSFFANIGRRIKSVFKKAEPQSVPAGNQDIVTTVESYNEEKSETESAGVHECDDNEGALYTNLKSLAWKGLYILAHLSVLSRLFYKSIYIPSYRISHTTSYDYIFISLFVLITVTSMIVYRWFEESGNKTGKKTVVTLFKIVSAVSAVTAICWSARAIVRWDLTYPLFLFYKLTAAYIIAAVLYSLFIEFINGTIMRNFDITYLFLESEREKESFIELLQKNTGLSLKSLWSLGYILDVCPYAVIFSIVMVFAFTSVYKVEPYQQAVLYHLGQISRESVKGPGLHLKYPWPIDKTEYYDVARIKTYQVGYESKRTSVDMLWTQEHEGGEFAFLLGDGNELIAVNINVNYVIKDLYEYITTCSNVEPYINAFTYETLMGRIIRTTLDDFIQENRTMLSENVRDEVNRMIDEAHLGIEIKDVMIGAIHPPVEIAPIYQGVVGAQNRKKTKILKAEAAELASKSDAEKESKSVVLRAQAKQHKNVSEARHDTEVYSAAYEGYKLSPESYIIDREMSAFEKVVKGRKVYVITPGMGSDLSGIIINKGPADSVIPALSGKK